MLISIGSFHFKLYAISVNSIRHYSSLTSDKNKVCGDTLLPGPHKSMAELKLNQKFEALKIAYQYLI